MSNQKLFHQNIVLNIAKNRCNSAQTSTKYWSISLKFGSFKNSYLAQSAGSGSVVGEGKVKCQISPKHPLKLVNLAAHRKLSLYQRMIGLL